MKENLDNTLKTSSMDLTEFDREIKELFRYMPTSEEVRTRLVPNGVTNSAYASSTFKKGDIFKYVFKLKDGNLITLWLHKANQNAKSETNSYCLSQNNPTAQFSRFDPNTMLTYRLIKVGKKPKWLEMRIFSDEEINMSHFPIFKFNTK